MIDETKIEELRRKFGYIGRWLNVAMRTVKALGLRWFWIKLRPGVTVVWSDEVNNGRD